MTIFILFFIVNQEWQLTSKMKWIEKRWAYVFSNDSEQRGSEPAVRFCVVYTVEIINTPLLLLSSKTFSNICTD